MKYWEPIANRLSKAGWRCGCISSTDEGGNNYGLWPQSVRTAAYFIVRADEKLSAFLELESAIPFLIQPAAD